VSNIRASREGVGGCSWQIHSWWEDLRRRGRWRRRVGDGNDADVEYTTAGWEPDWFAAALGLDSCRKVDEERRDVVCHMRLGFSILAPIGGSVYRTRQRQ